MQKLLSMLLIAALCLSLLPAGFAEEIQIVGDGVLDPCHPERSEAEPKDLSEDSSSLSLLRMTDETNEIVASGECGDNLIWTLDDAGTLTISGNGEMYSPGDVEKVPWYSLRSNILHVAVCPEVTSIGDNAFYDCENLIDVNISGPVTSFGNYAFSNCKSLSFVSIPETLTSVGTMAFNYCENLNNITLPETMSEIGWDVFTGCKKLTRFVIPNGLTQIPQGLLNGCSGLTEIVIPENVTYIGPMAFAGCSALEEITLPSGIMDVQSHLFEGCSSLKSISIPEKVGSIGPDAFYNCTSLTYVVIPKSVNRVYNDAFENCSALKEVYYGGSADDWDAMSIEIHNDDLTCAHIHYNSTGPERDDRLDCCLSRSSTDYDNELAVIAAELSLASYTGEGDSDVRAQLYSLGFADDHIYSNNYGGSLAFTLATKPYCGDDKSDCADVLVIVAQGSTNPYELLSDSLSLTSSGINGLQTYNIVKDFYNAISDGMAHMINEGLFSEDKNYKVLLTGHSLGGAAVDLYSAAYTDLNSANDVFCYTFGAINSIKSDSCMGYANIHNVYNDLDTFAPAQYGWVLVNGAGGKYGKLGHLDTFSREYRENFYHNPFLNALQEAEIEVARHVNHDMSNYLEAVCNGRVNHSTLYDYPSTTIACPVDVDVFCDGVLVGRVKNNEIDQSATSIDITVEGEAKIIFNPDNRPLDYLITAYDEGAMTYYTQNPIGAGSSKLMYNIGLTSGKELYSEVGGTIETQDVKLYILDEEGTPVLEVQEDGTEKTIAPELRLSDLSTDGITLHWSPIYGANGYLLQIQTADCIGFIELAETDYLYTDTQVGESYTFSVKALMGDSNSDWSNEIELLFNPVQGYVVAIDEEKLPEGVTVTLPEGDSFSGEVTFTVSSPNDLAVLVAVKNGDEYTVLPCTDKDGCHCFTLNVTKDTELVLVYKGDANLDGQVKLKDNLMVKKLIARSALITDPLALLVADVDGNGEIKLKDNLMIKKHIAKSQMLEW